jgi:hypothetical protein
MQNSQIFRNAAVLFALTVFASGCATSFQPDKLYSGERPFGDTSVFSAYDDRSQLCTVSNVLKVDGLDTSRVRIPIWVRVAPGSHAFTVQCSRNFSTSSAAIQYSRQELPAVIQNMKPGYVYVARFSTEDQTIKLRVEELPKAANYSVPLGLDGVKSPTKPQF